MDYERRPVRSILHYRGSAYFHLSDDYSDVYIWEEVSEYDGPLEDLQGYHVEVSGMGPAVSRGNSGGNECVFSNRNLSLNVVSSPDPARNMPWNSFWIVLIVLPSPGGAPAIGWGCI